MDYLTTHTSPSLIRRGFAPGFVIYKKGCTRLAAASDKDYQLLAQRPWFSPGTPASSITKTGIHDIAEILLKVALNPKIHHLYVALYVITVVYENKDTMYIIMFDCVEYKSLYSTLTLYLLMF